MKKKNHTIIAVVIVILTATILTGCECKHKKWNEATCTKPKTCAECGVTEGEALGHEWLAADCENPRRCSVCGVTDGVALGHTWKEATCEVPRTCSICFKTDGDPSEHNIEKWNIIEEPSCNKEGTESGECTVCHNSITRTIGKTEHTPGEWEITLEPTPNSDGIREQKCGVCGQTIQTENFSMSAEEIENDYKSKCENYTYDEIARNPDEYEGKYAKFTGQVIQVLEEDDIIQIRMNITLKGEYYVRYDDTIMVGYKKKDGEGRILEDDVITIYGELNGITSYTSVMGANITLPLVIAKYIDY